MHTLVLHRSVQATELSVALVGCGAIVEHYYLPALQHLQQTKALTVTALVDPESSRLHVLGRAFPHARQLTSIADLSAKIASSAIVASPQRFHAEQSIRLLQSGMHVLCEKPMASNIAEGRSMVDATNETRCLLAVGLLRRFFPSTEFIRQFIESGALGKPLKFEWREGGPFNWFAASPSFFTRSSSQGGVLADLGVHVLDLLLHWFGAVSDVQYKDDAMGGLETNARLQLRFASGVEGTVRLSRDTELPVGTQILFEKGIVGLNGATADQVVLSIDGCSKLVDARLFNYQTGNQDRRADLAGGPSFTYHQCFVEQLRNFCRAIRGEEALRVPGSEALCSMELIERCYDERKAMELPWLSAKEQASVLLMQP